MTVKSILIGLAAIATAAGANATAFAQKVAYYDHSEVVRESKAFKSIQSQLDTKRNEISAQLKPLADEVSQEGEAIKQVTSGLDEKAIREQHGERIGKFQQKLQQLEVSQQRVNQEFGIVVELTEQKINATIVDVIDDVAKSKRVDVLMSQMPLSHYDKKYDATAEVLAAVDRRLTSLSIDALVEEAAAKSQQTAQSN